MQLTPYYCSSYPGFKLPKVLWSFRRIEKAVRGEQRAYLSNSPFRGHSTVLMKKAPPFFLTAVGAARVVGGPPGPASPLLLIFHDNSGAETAYNINVALRKQYPLIHQLQIVSVICLRQIPQFMRPTVDQAMLAAYHKTAESMQDERDPSEYVIIVPDWEAKVASSFGMGDCHDQIGLALITPPWQISDVYQGPDPIDAALRMLNAASNPGTDGEVKPSA